MTPTMQTGNMIQTPFYKGGADPATGALDAAKGFSGVYRQTLTATHDFDDMLCWQIDRPYPFALMAINAFLKSEDRLDGD